LTCVGLFSGFALKIISPICRLFHKGEPVSGFAPDWLREMGVWAIMPAGRSRRALEIHHDMKFRYRSERKLPLKSRLTA